MLKRPSVVVHYEELILHKSCCHAGVGEALHQPSIDETAVDCGWCCPDGLIENTY
jgi:hypothetical protein